MTPTAERPVAFRPHPRQELFLANSADECLFGGAAGGGKTETLLFGALRYVHVPGARALIVRRTFPELRELMDRALAVFQGLGGEWNASEKRWRWPGGGSVEFGYVSSWADVLQYQGQEYWYIAWDELTQCPEERIWTYLLSRLRSTDAGVPKLARASTNPGGPGHAWVKRRFVDVVPDWDGGAYTDPVSGLTRAFVSSRLDDNPTLLAADPQYRKRLMLLPERERRQLLEGDWDTAEGAAFPEVTEGRHVIADSPRDVLRVALRDGWPLWLGHDWGYAHWAVTAAFTLRPDGRPLVLDTLWLRRRRDDELARAIADWAPWAVEDPACVMYCGGDVFAKHEARDTVPASSEAYRAVGLTPTRAPLGAGSRRKHAAYLRRIVAWRGVVETDDGMRDGEPLLQWCDTPGNRRAVRQIAELQVDPDDPEDVLKVDADESGHGGDDAYDATRYGLLGRRTPAVPPFTRDPERAAWVPTVGPDGRATVRPWTPRDTLKERMRQAGVVEDTEAAWWTDWGRQG